VQTHELKQLLQEALRVYSAAGATSVMPEEITNVFIRVYSEILDPAARTDFFSLLARDFGVQGGMSEGGVCTDQESQKDTACGMMQSTCAVLLSS
jgi:hypothetical protein